MKVVRADFVPHKIENVAVGSHIKDPLARLALDLQCISRGREESERGQHAGV